MLVDSESSVPAVLAAAFKDGAATLAPDVETVRFADIAPACFLKPSVIHEYMPKCVEDAHVSRYMTEYVTQSLKQDAFKAQLKVSKVMDKIPGDQPSQTTEQEYFASVEKIFDLKTVWRLSGDLSATSWRYAGHLLTTSLTTF